jgi:hypothetical protein
LIDVVVKDFPLAQRLLVREKVSTRMTPLIDQVENHLRDTIKLCRKEKRELNDVETRINKIWNEDQGSKEMRVLRKKLSAIFN